MTLDQQIALFTDESPLKGRFMVMEGSLDRDLEIGDVQVTRQDSLHRIRIEARNTKRRDLDFAYSIRWATKGTHTYRGTSGEAWKPAHVDKLDLWILDIITPDETVDSFEVALKLIAKEE